MEDRAWQWEPVSGPSWPTGQLEAFARPAILAIEHQQEILEVLGVLLERAGFACVGCRTAEAGLDHLRERTFDLVLANYALPNRPGGWMLTQACAEGLLDATPVLVVTAHPDPEGVSGFEIVRKPFDLDQLVHRVRQRVEGGNARAPRPRTAPASRQDAEGSGDAADDRPRIELILYISSHSPRSVTAVDNLKRALARYRPSRVRLTVCDLAENPAAGDADKIAFTPTLVKRSPGPRTFILGHLSNPDLLLEILDSES